MFNMNNINFFENEKEISKFLYVLYVKTSIIFDIEDNYDFEVNYAHLMPKLRKYAGGRGFIDVCKNTIEFSPFCSRVPPNELEYFKENYMKKDFKCSNFINNQFMKLKLKL